jgi:hypothetical protein
MPLSVELTLALTVLIDQRRTRLRAEEQIEDQQEEEERTAVIHRSSTPRGFLRIGLFSSGRDGEHREQKTERREVQSLQILGKP